MDNNSPEYANNLKIWSRQLAALGQKDRFTIMTFLSANPGVSVTDIATTMGIEIANASAHLAVLTNAGLVDYVKDGRFSRYSLAAGVYLEPERIEDAGGWNLSGLKVYLTDPDSPREAAPVPKSKSKASRRGARKEVPSA